MKAIKHSGEINNGYLFNGKGTVYDSPLSSYPRIQLKRDSYQCLNGLWDIKITKEDILPSTFDKKVQVPFSLEALDSLVNYLPEPDDYIFYHKVVTLEDDFIKDELIIHFEGVDQEATVYIDRKEVLHHIGMYEPFEVVLDKNTPKVFDLIVKVRDKSDTSPIARGKQSLNPVYWTYSTTTGIYKPVWMESVNKNYIKDIRYTPDFENKVMKIIVSTPIDTKVRIKVADKEFEIDSNVESTLDIGEFHLWSITDPYLYMTELEIDGDKVSSYFAIRKIEIKEIGGFKRLYLNDKPIFLSGILDQGYYGYNNLTPTSYDEYEKDIRLTKEMGFNCLRVHIKTECDQFYYLADKLGILLIQDFPSGGLPVPLLHNALPRVFKSHNCEKYVKYDYLGREDKEGRDHFINECHYYLKHFHNHPSVIIYTIFNESWGEFDPSLLYEELKKEEDYMLFDTASGWCEADKSDFYSVHTYSFPAMKRENRFKRCFIISEAGGVGLRLGNVPYKKYTAHGKATNRKQLAKKIENLYLKKLLPQIKKYGLCGIIYTQLADVETEYNGLFDLTRDTCKVDKESINNINNKLYKEYEDVSK